MFCYVKSSSAAVMPGRVDSSQVYTTTRSTVKVVLQFVSSLQRWSLMTETIPVAHLKQFVIFVKRTFFTVVVYNCGDEKWIVRSYPQVGFERFYKSISNGTLQS